MNRLWGWLMVQAWGEGLHFVPVLGQADELWHFKLRLAAAVVHAHQRFGGLRDRRQHTHSTPWHQHIHMQQADQQSFVGGAEFGRFI